MNVIKTALELLGMAAFLGLFLLPSHYGYVILESPLWLTISVWVGGVVVLYLGVRRENKTLELCTCKTDGKCLKHSVLAECGLCNSHSQPHRRCSIHRKEIV